MSKATLHTRAFVVAVTITGFAAAGACRPTPQPVPTLSPAPPPPPEADRSLPPYEVAFQRADDATDVKALVEAVVEVFASPEFSRRLSRVQVLSGGADRSCTRGDVVLTELLGQARAKPVEAKFVSAEESCKEKGSETADTSVSLSGAVVCLQAVVLSRWKDKEPSAKACAVNTIAHEWTHAIPTASGDFLYTDRGHSDSASPLVSYTVGAIAQCAYLERANHVSMDDQAFWKCVTDAGTVDFFSTSCASAVAVPAASSGRIGAAVP